MSSLFPAQPGNEIVNGRREANLPPFRTILIKGEYHPSAPIHLCLSHLGTKPQQRALFLTPSRLALKESLQKYNDDWLNVYPGHGRVLEVTNRIDVLSVSFAVVPS